MVKKMGGVIEKYMETLSFGIEYKKSTNSLL